MSPLRPALFVAALATTAAAQQRVTTGTVLVANQQAATATIVDIATQSTTTLDVGTGPHEAVISPDGRWGIITVYGIGGSPPGNKLAVIDLTAKQVVRTIDLGTYTRPHGAAFVAGQPNVVAVTSETTQNVVLVDIAKGEVLGAIPTQRPASHMLGVTADGKRAYTASITWGGISEMDLEKRAFVRELKAGSGTEGIAVAPDGSTVWVGSRDSAKVIVIDTKSWTVEPPLSGFGLPYRIEISPDGKTAVVCDPGMNKIHIVDAKSRKVTGEVSVDGSPRGVKIAPDNRTLFVTLAGVNKVAAIDLVERRVLWTAPVGAAPDGVWYGPTPR